MLGKFFGSDESKSKKLPGKKAEDVEKGSTGHVATALKTEMAFLLDRSGSMSSFANEAISGFNDFVDSQKKIAGEADLTLCLFDDDILHPMNGVDLKDANRLDSHTYKIGGQTALWDAIGKTMGEMMARHSAQGHPGRVIMVILTDGEENASREFSATIIKDLVRRAKMVYGWEFIIIGVGVNAEKIAADIGIDEHCALPEHGTREGMSRAFAASAKAVTHFRKTGDVKLLKGKD